MLNAELVNPFVEAAFEVFIRGAEIELKRASLSIRQCSVTTRPVNVHINFSGEIHGQIFYGMSVQTAKQIASKMIGQRLRMLNDFAQSALSELGNMITGHATAKLEEFYPNLNISPPTVIIGDDVLVSTVDVNRLYILLDSDIGEVEISVVIEKHEIPDKINITYLDKTETVTLV